MGNKSPAWSGLASGESAPGLLKNLLLPGKSAKAPPSTPATAELDRALVDEWDRRVAQMQRTYAHQGPTSTPGAAVGRALFEKTFDFAEIKQPRLARLRRVAVRRALGKSIGRRLGSGRESQAEVGEARGAFADALDHAEGEGIGG